jgi:hypothetical protein
MQLPRFDRGLSSQHAARGQHDHRFMAGDVNFIEAVFRQRGESEFDPAVRQSFGDDSGGLLLDAHLHARLLQRKGLQQA